MTKVLSLTLGLLLLAAVAFALPPNIQQMQDGTYRNVASGEITDANGNALSKEVAPIVDQNFVFQNIISNAALALAGADSSGILDTHTMRLGTLLLKVVPNGGAAQIRVRLAVQIREHLGGVADSMSTFAVYPYASLPAQAAGVLDTLLVGNLATGSASTPWSGEFVVTVDGARNAPNSGVAATAFTYPNGIAIPLSSYFGRDIYVPHCSVRIRVLSGPTCQVYASLEGTPL